jgi:hypothetical protein
MALDLPDKRASSDQPIAGGKPTSHLLIRGSGLDYFRVADKPGVISVSGKPERIITPQF